eukprot:gene8680-1071_t
MAYAAEMVYAAAIQELVHCLTHPDTPVDMLVLVARTANACKERPF